MATTPSTHLEQQPAYRALHAHHREVAGLHLRDLFAGDPGRGTRLTAEAAGLFLDYSKHRVTDETLRLLVQLAGETGVAERRDAMFSGDLQQLADTWVIADEELARIKVPYTLVHGRDDLPCPVDVTSLVLAGKIRNSSVVLLANCGHAPAAERPAEVCAAVQLAFASCADFGTS